jgi:hypothetical protein
MGQVRGTFGSARLPSQSPRSEAVPSDTGDNRWITGRRLHMRYSRSTGNEKMPWRTSPVMFP